MCNRFRVSATQMEIAKPLDFPIDNLMPEPEPLPPPELFPKKIGWIVRGVSQFCLCWKHPPSEGNCRRLP